MEEARLAEVDAVVRPDEEVDEASMLEPECGCGGDEVEAEKLAALAITECGCVGNMEAKLNEFTTLKKIIDKIIKLSSF